MLIQNEDNKTIIIDSLYAPIVSDYMWVLDLNMMDYTLTPIKMLEEVVCPTMTLDIRGYYCKIPANWYMLVYDVHTTQLDSIVISDLSNKQYSALVYGSSMKRPEPAIITVVDYELKAVNTYPSFNRHLMLCHSIDTEKWVTISFSDTYNRFLRNKDLSDIIQ